MNFRCHHRKKIDNEMSVKDYWDKTRTFSVVPSCLSRQAYKNENAASARAKARESFEAVTDYTYYIRVQSYLSSLSSFPFSHNVSLSGLSRTRVRKSSPLESSLQPRLRFSLHRQFYNFTLPPVLTKQTQIILAAGHSSFSVFLGLMLYFTIQVKKVE